MSTLTGSCVTFSTGQTGSLTSDSRRILVTGCPTHPTGLLRAACSAWIYIDAMLYSVIATVCCTILKLPCAVLPSVVQGCAAAVKYVVWSLLVNTNCR